ncbi:MAG TPA: tetratricopeptide repeat protein [Chitinophagaceae bacterium]|nr:tetratricopeptide repeat protein [Chitinophagaceae bacterium]
MSSTRQLAAIMFTDIVGYTALMGKDEKKAFELLNKNRQIQKPIIEQYNGRWIKELGDGVMASFNTVSDAVNAAIKIQEACNSAKEFQLRIGIHQGEVVIEENDVFGDAVNIASRIQSIAAPGSIFVSEVVHHNVANKNDIETEFVKTEVLKNVKQPIKIYRVKLDGSVPLSHFRSFNSYKKKKFTLVFLGILVLAVSGYFIYNSLQKTNSAATVATLDKSIAVLPFANRSNDKDQEYFSDGLSEELLNMLAKVPELKVIGRTSSFAFKGKNEDLRSIGKQLGVAHLLEGSVRKDGDKIRVTARLINAADGSDIWNDSYDRDLKNIFKLQEEIAQDVVEKLKLKLLQFPSTNVSGTGSVEAYNLVLQGNYFYDNLDKENVAKAVDLYKQALAIDSTNARAWERLANAVSRQAWQNYVDRKIGREQAKNAALKAIALDKNLAEGYGELGDLYLYSEFNWKAAEETYLKALKLQPDNPDILYSLGGGLYFAIGRWDDAISKMKRCIELDPLKPISHLNLGNILSHAGRYDEATAYLKKALELNPQFQRAHLYLGRNYLIAGKIDLALKEMQEENLEVFRSFGTALAYYGAGKKKEADEALKNFMDKFQNEWNYLAAELYAYRGENDKALLWLENAFQSKDGWLVFLKGDPLMKNLETDLRYKTFLNKMNLSFD